MTHLQFAELDKHNLTDNLIPPFQEGSLAGCYPAPSAVRLWKSSWDEADHEPGISQLVIALQPGTVIGIIPER